MTYLLHPYRKKRFRGYVSSHASSLISTSGAGGGGIVLLLRTPVCLSQDGRNCRFITRAETRLGPPPPGAMK